MTSRIERTRRAIAARSTTRPEGEAARDAAAPERVNLPVPVEPVARTARPDRRDNGATFAAQMMGQDGQKRGLRGGQPVLEAAKRTYSSIEWSGAADRRARKGRQARTEA